MSKKNIIVNFIIQKSKNETCFPQKVYRLSNPRSCDSEFRIFISVQKMCPFVKFGDEPMMMRHNLFSCHALLTNNHTDFLFLFVDYREDNVMVCEALVNIFPLHVSHCYGCMCSVLFCFTSSKTIFSIC